MFVYEQSEVTTNRRELAQFLEFDFVFPCSLHQFCPVYLGIIDVLVNPYAVRNFLRKLTKLGPQFATAVTFRQSVGINIVVGLALNYQSCRNSRSDEDVFNVCFQLIKGGILVSVRPTALHALACYPQRKTAFLRVGTDRRIVIVLFRCIMIHVAHFEELQIDALTIDVSCQRFEATEHHCLPHHAQISTQRVHHPDGISPRKGVKLVMIIVCRLGQ